jgi:hypothetical protein
MEYISRRVMHVVLFIALGLAGSQVPAQPIGPRARPLNTGLIGGVVLDPSGKGIAGATVSLDHVAADVSSCVLRIYGPNRGMLRNLTTNQNGVFLIAFDWEPEQLGCVIGGGAPRAHVTVLAFAADNSYQKSAKNVPLLLAPSLQTVLNGVTPGATGPLGEELNKGIKDYSKDNPALKAYLRTLSNAMSVELYALMGDAGAIEVARP